MKKTLRIHFTDFWEPFDAEDNLWMDILRTRYDVRLDPEDPEFLIHSCFGYRHMNYDCVKICFLGENITPDFNLSDYANGFDHLEFEDRYMRMPLYRLCMGEEARQENTPEFFAREAASKTKFCNFLYSNTHHASPHRERFLDLLSRYKPVDCGGKVRNTTGFLVGDKCAWQRQFKFSIAFENSCKNGYTTEKIYDAMRAHTIPIYWGNPRVAEDFNPGRFINCHDFASFEDVVAHVRELDGNPARYVEMLSRPWFCGETPTHPRHDKTYTDFLLGIVSQGPNAARRVTHDGASRSYRDRILHRTKPLTSAMRQVRNYLRRMGHRVKAVI